LSPESFAELAALSSRIKKIVEELDDPSLVTAAADQLLAWLVERGEEIA
jgi:hypothetical protein